MSNEVHAMNTVIAFFNEKNEQSEGNQSALISLQRQIIMHAGESEFIEWACYGSHDLSYLEKFDTTNLRVAFLKDNRHAIESMVQEAQEHYAHYLIGAIHTRRFNYTSAVEIIKDAVNPYQINAEMMDSVMSDLINRTKIELSKWIRG